MYWESGGKLGEMKGFWEITTEFEVLAMNQIPECSKLPKKRSECISSFLLLFLVEMNFTITLF
jgi:hypothetical protein